MNLLRKLNGTFHVLLNSKILEFTNSINFFIFNYQSYHYLSKNN